MFKKGESNLILSFKLGIVFIGILTILQGTGDMGVITGSVVSDNPIKGGIGIIEILTGTLLAASILIPKFRP